MGLETLVRKKLKTELHKGLYRMYVRGYNEGKAGSDMMSEKDFKKAVGEAVDKHDFNEK